MINSEIKPDEYYTVREIAEKLRVAPGAVSGWAKQAGFSSPYPRSELFRFKGGDILEFIQEPSEPYAFYSDPESPKNCCESYGDFLDEGGKFGGGGVLEIPCHRICDVFGDCYFHMFILEAGENWRNVDRAVSILEDEHTGIIIAYRDYLIERQEKNIHPSSILSFNGEPLPRVRRDKIELLEKVISRRNS